MDIEITCPMCNFSNKVPGEKIPEGVKWAICPNCKYRFEFASFIHDTEKEEVSPWERRMELGLWKGIYQTFISVLFSPIRFFREMTSGKGISEPLAFGLLSGSLGYMIGFFWEFILISWGIMPNGIPFSEIPLIWLFLTAMILSPVLVILNMFITGAVIHVLMLAFNDGKGGFEGSFKVVAFGQATKVIGFIPFIGWLAGWLWNLVVVVGGLKEIHETSFFKATAAVIISIILKVLLLLPVFLLINIFKKISL